MYSPFAPASGAFQLPVTLVISSAILKSVGLSGTSSPTKAEASAILPYPFSSNTVTTYVFVPFTQVLSSTDCVLPGAGLSMVAMSVPSRFTTAFFIAARACPFTLFVGHLKLILAFSSPSLAAFTARSVTASGAVSSITWSMPMLPMYMQNMLASLTACTPKRYTPSCSIFTVRVMSESSIDVMLMESDIDLNVVTSVLSPYPSIIFSRYLSIPFFAVMEKV